jgi:hypothetical protein
MFAGYYDTHEWQYTLLVIYNLSYTTALYALLVFYMGWFNYSVFTKCISQFRLAGTKTQLHGFNPIGKFAAVKIIVFATYYQSLLVDIIPGMDSLGGTEKWNDFIL